MEIPTDVLLDTSFAAISERKKEEKKRSRVKSFHRLKVVRSCPLFYIIDGGQWSVLQPFYDSILFVTDFVVVGIPENFID